MSEQTAGFVAAYAKINLTLEVLGRRADGYHTLASVLQTISLHDTLHIAARPEGEVTFTCDAAPLAGAENLVPRAAHVLRAAVSLPTLGATLELRKQVPAQAGLGGGSSDAATTLLALARLWGLRLSHATLETVGATLGSDVPFFLTGGTARIAGRGEHVHPLPDVEPFWLVLAKPPVDLPTARIFQQLTPADYSAPEATETLEATLRAQRPIAFEQFANGLERTVLASVPAVAEARAALFEAGAPLVRMSGSGPSLYAPFRGLAEAAVVYERARARRLRVWLCHTVTRAASVAASQF